MTKVESGRQSIECHQAELFLKGLVEHGPIEHRSPNDPPDIRVIRPGLPDLFLEVVESHPSGQRVGIEKRWRCELWPTIDALRRQRSALAAASAMVVFKDHDKPPARRHHQVLATEFVRLAEFLLARLATSGQEIKVSFIRRDKIGPFRVIQPGWEWLPEEEWPTLAMHVSSFQVRREDQASWLLWSCLQTDTGLVHYSEMEFRRIFDGKRDKVRNATASGKFDPSSGPLWLLAVADTRDDISSHIYPTDSSDLEQLAQVVAGSMFDFHDSPFQEVWLLSHFSGAKLRLFPIT